MVTEATSVNEEAPCYGASVDSGEHDWGEGAWDEKKGWVYICNDCQTEYAAGGDR